MPSLDPSLCNQNQKWGITVKKIFIGALLAAAAATPAMAQDNAGFTGGHIEAIGGWDKVDSDINVDGFTYGLGAGYDFDTGGMVVGLEGEITDSTAKKCAEIPGYKACAKAGRDLYVGARLGTTIGASKNTLLYAKGGYTNAASELEETETVGTVTTVTNYSSKDDGWRVGAGLETKTSNNLLLKGEYRYSDYGDGVNRHQVLAGVGIRF